MHHFAVIGNPIKHSLSPDIHQQFAKQFNLDITYKKILSPLDKFSETIDELRKAGINGVNITIPFKQNAFQYANECTKRAINAGAVNTFIFKDNQCIGDNTDGIGFIRDLENKKISLKNKRILILGAGGAAQGIIPALKTQSPKQIAILNRTEKKALKITSMFNCDIFKKDRPYDLLINTTNADFENADYFNEICNLSNLDCYDLNYGDRHYSFKKWAQSRNAKSCHDGFGMLVEQAAESFYLWTGMKPDTAYVLDIGGAEVES